MSRVTLKNSNRLTGYSGVLEEIALEGSEIRFSWGKMMPEDNVLEVVINGTDAHMLRRKILHEFVDLVLEMPRE